MPHPRVVVTILLLLVGSLVQPAGLRAEDPGAPIFDVTIRLTDLLLDTALAMEQTEMDCSHLVHDLYHRVGLDYDYANSISLYKGVSAFRRVARPQAGDLIVWRGHVGIVADPEEQTFVSALRTGVKVSSYVSRYWMKKGIPRFLHYVGTEGAIESAAIE